MEPDELQSLWRAHEAPQVNLDTDTLLNLVKRNQREFHGTILKRDVVEVATAIALVGFFSFVGVAQADWSWFVMAAGGLFVAVFMLVDRWQQRCRRASSADTLAERIESARTEVEHQVWLLKNVFWWYLLPFLVGFTCVFGKFAWEMLHLDAGAAILSAIPTVMLVGSYLFAYGIYIINQRAVRNDLQPRLEELHALAKSLSRNGQ